MDTCCFWESEIVNYLFGITAGVRVCFVDLNLDEKVKNEFTKKRKWKERAKGRRQDKCGKVNRFL